MVAWVVQRLRRLGRNPAILTRGYSTAGEAGDEAALLQMLTGAPVVINADRVAGAKLALEEGADVLVMDDGFQHRRLRRDLDIVLIDATNPFGYGWCLPRGLLREPRRALHDAHAVVITRSNRVSAAPLEELRGRLERLAPGAAVCTAVHRPAAVLGQDGQHMPLKALEGRSVFAFCGIANPEAFFAALSELGARIVGRQALQDHVHYSEEVVEALRRVGIARPADVFVTTQKDYIKVAHWDLGLPVWRLAVEMSPLAGRGELLDRIGRAVAG
jgi:tetraacyldisaccharide 4'-kinase